MTWDPEATAAFWINRASKVLLKQLDEALGPFGLAMSYFAVLRTLVDGQARSQTELAQAAGVELPSMAETLTRMERDGVVQRRQNPADRRSTLVSLTRRARSSFLPAKAALLDCERRAMSGFSLAEAALLRMFLQRVVANLADASPPPVTGPPPPTRPPAAARRPRTKRAPKTKEPT